MTAQAVLFTILFFFICNFQLSIAIKPFWEFSYFADSLQRHGTPFTDVYKFNQTFIRFKNLYCDPFDLSDHKARKLRDCYDKWTWNSPITDCYQNAFINVSPTHQRDIECLEGWEWIKFQQEIDLCMERRQGIYYTIHLDSNLAWSFQSHLEMCYSTYTSGSVKNGLNYLVLVILNVIALQMYLLY